MILQFDNVGRSMDWTMLFSMCKWLILTVAYLVLRLWKYFELVTKLVLDHIPASKKAA
jgi:hypothetical protein